MKICMMVNGQAGMVGLLTVLSLNHDVVAVVCYDDITRDIRRIFNIINFGSIYDKDFTYRLKKCDLLLSVHGCEIVSKDLLGCPAVGCINFHPCLSMYKGVSPVERLLKDGGTMASVGSHWMSERVDEGEVIVERFKDVSGCGSVEEIYNRLYPVYLQVVSETLFEPEVCGAWNEYVIDLTKC